MQAGEHVQITDRGKLVVEIVPPGHATPELDLPATILALAHRGLHTLAPDRSPYSYHRPGTPLLRSGTAEELLNEERAE